MRSGVISFKNLPFNQQLLGIIPPMSSPALIRETTDQYRTEVLWKKQWPVDLRIWALDPPASEVLFTHPVKFWLERPLFLIFVAHIVKKVVPRSFQPQMCKSKSHILRSINRNPRGVHSLPQGHGSPFPSPFSCPHRRTSPKG